MTVTFNNHFTSHFSLMSEEHVEKTEEELKKVEAEKEEEELKKTEKEEEELKKTEKEEKELKKELIEEFIESDYGPSVLEKYIKQGDFRSFRLLFEQVRSTWFLTNFAVPWDLMISAAKEGNVEICKYLTEYVPPTQIIGYDGSIFHMAVRTGSLKAVKNICELYKAKDPDHFKELLTQVAKFMDETVSPYQLALSLSMFRGSRYKEIVEYLKQFEESKEETEEEEADEEEADEEETNEEEADEEETH